MCICAVGMGNVLYGCVCAQRFSPLTPMQPRKTDNTRTGSFVFVDPLLYDQQAAVRAVQAFLKTRNHSSEEEAPPRAQQVPPPMPSSYSSKPPSSVARSSLTMEGVEAVRKVLVSALFPSATAAGEGKK